LTLNLFNKFKKKWLHEKQTEQHLTLEKSKHLTEERKIKTACVERSGRRTFRKLTEFLSAVMQKKQGNVCVFPNVSAVTLLVMCIAYHIEYNALIRRLNSSIFI
jgi:hypothetical protein